MARVYKRRQTSQRYTARAFLPYVTALGQVALAWNDLQESFADLFWTSTLRERPQGGDSIDYTSLRIWHSLRSDRQQRGILRDLLEHLPGEWQHPSFIQAAKDALKEADKLEDARNDAIHSPLFYSPNSLYGDMTRKEKVAPSTWLFNPRAVKLSERESLLTEFRYCRDRAIELSDYVRAINSAVVNPHLPWPGKLKLRLRQGQSQAQPRRPHDRKARKISG
jgi:hypothetical protein